MCYQLKVGDGTTSVTLLASEFLKQIKPFVEEGVHPQIIVKSFRKAVGMVSIPAPVFIITLSALMSMKHCSCKMPHAKNI